MLTIRAGSNYRDILCNFRKNGGLCLLFLWCFCCLLLVVFLCHLIGFCVDDVVQSPLSAVCAFSTPNLVHIDNHGASRFMGWQTIRVCC